MTQRRRMTMLRSYTAADAFTSGNASCGTVAVFLCLEYVDAHQPGHDQGRTAADYRFAGRASAYQ